MGYIVRRDQDVATSGTLAGATAALFQDDPYVAITSTSFVVPSAGMRVLTGLVPGGAYTVTPRPSSAVAGSRSMREVPHKPIPWGALDLN